MNAEAIGELVERLARGIDDDRAAEAMQQPRVKDELVRRDMAGVFGARGSVASSGEIIALVN